ncbi:MAG: hypothetical protein WAV05_07055 [Anaerolineales bacterium]
MREVAPFAMMEKIGSGYNHFIRAGLVGFAGYALPGGAIISIILKGGME